MTTTYKTIQGDTWDLIAVRCYGDEHRMAELIAANAQHRHVVLFPAGVVLEVPELDAEAVSSDSLPPWKQGASQ